MKRAIVCVAAVLLLVGVPSAVKAVSETEVKGLEELVSTEGRFGDTRVRPGADFSQYTKVYPAAAVFQFTEETGGPVRRTGTLMNDPNQQSMYGEEENRIKFKQIVSHAVIDELARRGLQRADEPGPDTLSLQLAVLDISSHIPAATVRQVGIAVDDVGKATVVFALIDSESGVIQARVAERRLIRRVDQGFGSIEPDLVWPEVDRWARRAAWDLQRTLESVQE